MIVINIYGKDNKRWGNATAFSYNAAEKALITIGFYESSGIYRHLDGRTASMGNAQLPIPMKKTNKTIWSSIFKQYV